MLIFGNIFFGLQYYFAAKTNAQLQQQLQTRQVNVKIVNFLNLFIVKVLKSNTEISFEDRLKLENAVRDINDPQILATWQKFTAGTNETEVQAGVKDLLQILASKIVY